MTTLRVKAMTMLSWLIVCAKASLVSAASAIAATGTATTPASPAGAATPALQGLAGLREEVVLAGALLNGNRLDVSRFVDDRAPDVLIEQVRRIWSQRPAPIHDGERDGWFTLTQLAGSSVETLEVKASGSGAQGRRFHLSRGDGGPFADSAWLDTTLPASSRVIDRVTHDDGGRRMTTLVAVTSAGITAASLELLSALKRRGFRSGSRGTPSFTGAGQVFFLARGSEDVALTISEHAGQRAVVMHWGRALR